MTANDKRSMLIREDEVVLKIEKLFDQQVKKLLVLSNFDEEDCSLMISSLLELVKSFGPRQKPFAVSFQQKFDQRIFEFLDERADHLSQKELIEIKLIIERIINPQDAGENNIEDKTVIDDQPDSINQVTDALCQTNSTILDIVATKKIAQTGGLK